MHERRTRWLEWIDRNGLGRLLLAVWPLPGCRFQRVGRSGPSWSSIPRQGDRPPGRPGRDPARGRSDELAQDGRRVRGRADVRLARRRRERVRAAGRLAILEVIPNGTKVKKGDVLCRLDASEYAELLRRRRSTSSSPRLDALRRELDLEVAESAVVEYTEGTVEQSLETFAGEVAMAELERHESVTAAIGRRRMLSKGYVSTSQVKSEASSSERHAGGRHVAAVLAGL